LGVFALFSPSVVETSICNCMNTYNIHLDHRESDEKPD
jgi:hypothetical protein